MPLDGVVLAGIRSEIKKICGARVDKIYQPERDEIIIKFRGYGASYNLLLSACANAPRVHFTNQAKENPLQAPMFCMVLRKNLNGKLCDCIQPKFERILELWFDTVNEMGDNVKKRLIVEIMGKHSNIILVDEDGTVIDSAKRVTLEMSSVRQILPGRTYVAPPSDKLDPLTQDESLFDCIINEQARAYKNSIYQSFNGISPLAATEICHRARVESGFSPNSDAAAQNSARAIAQQFSGFVNEIKKEEFNPLIYDLGKGGEFYSLALKMYESLPSRTFETVSVMLEEYYREKETRFRLSQKSADVSKIISQNIERCVKKTELFERTRNEIKDLEKERLYGELLTANIYRIQAGQDVAVVENYYDQSTVSIPLDKSKTPTENAQAYYKKYQKNKRTEKALEEQSAQNREELLYLESVMSAIESCFEEVDIEEIRDELRELGYIKKGVKKQKRQKKAQWLHYKSEDGFDIYVGKNNKQNDELTMRFAEGNDIWLHTKNIPGSHVIIRTNNSEPPAKTIEEGAMLAAYFSKAQNGSMVPVDYTKKRHVKKPAGSKPGFVIYETNQTAYVTPSKDKLPVLVEGMGL